MIHHGWKMLWAATLLGILLTITGVAQEVGDEAPAWVPFEQPVLITSIGQSAGAAQAKVLALRAGLDFVYEQRASVDQLEGMKTLIIVLGASSKGLGAAGVNMDEELLWGDELVSAAKDLGIRIVAMHIEGSSRRGPSSDLVHNQFAPLADDLIVKGAPLGEVWTEDEAANGNEDGLFTLIAEEYGIPIQYIGKTLDAVDVLKEIFAVETTES